jgi:hypothetical protein
MIRLPKSECNSENRKNIALTNNSCNPRKKRLLGQEEKMEDILSSMDVSKELRSAGNVKNIRKTGKTIYDCNLCSKAIFGILRKAWKMTVILMVNVLQNVGQFRTACGRNA